MKRKILISVGILLIIVSAIFFTQIKNLLNQTTKVNDYNVIVVAFDGLQAKHLDAYGYPLQTTPNLDKFFKESYLFKNAVSPASWTVPTYMSIFTSLYPSEHKLVNKFIEYPEVNGTTTVAAANLKKLNPDAVTLAEILKKNGYATAGFTGDAGVSGAFGYSAGFDEYFDKETFGGFPTSVPKATDWLQKNKDKKFFLFLQGYDSHGQYAPKDGFDYRYVDKQYKGKYTGSIKEQEALREEGLANGKINLSPEDVKFWEAIYDEKINRADAEFGKFMESVQEMDLMKNTIIVVLSDHGTEFYEHNRFDHGHTLYGELLNVLFAIHMPGQKDSKDIKSLVSTIDVTPTILNILNIKDSFIGKMKGINLVPAFSGKDVSRDIFSETDYRLYTHKRSIQTPDGWKLIITMESLEKELYNLNSDPGEKNNLIDKEPKIAYELEQKIYKHLNEMNANGPWVLGCSPVYSSQCQAPGESKKKQ